MKNLITTGRRLRLLVTGMVLMSFVSQGQLSLDVCHAKAREHYPLIRQSELIDKIRDYTIDNAGKGYLPSISLSARATYQSDVTKIPLSLPNLAIESLTRDQYQAVAEVSQVIWDGGAIRTHKETTRSTANLEQQNLEVELYGLRERVDQLFFGILLVEEQLRQNEILEKELQNTFNRVKALAGNGMAQRTDLELVKVEQLKAGQGRIQLEATRESFRQMLSTLVGEPLPEGMTLEPPVEWLPEAYDGASRPEFLLFEAQERLLENQKQTLFAANRPKLGAFLQTGIGKPGLNMLKNDFSPYAIGGIRLTWNFGGFYTLKNNLLKIETNQQALGVRKEVFDFNNRLLFTRQKSETGQYRKLMAHDEEIVALRTSIRKAAEVKAENGVLSVSDLIREIHAEDLAIRERNLHQIRYLMAVYSLRNTLNR